MQSTRFALGALVLAVALYGCASSSDKSVKTNYKTQWTTVKGDVKSTTSAAEAVLKDLDLLEVKSSATNVDGMASGKKANGAKVDISVTRATDTTSNLSVEVGSLGDPSLGTDIARKIKARTEGSATTKP
jgi:hypothetical protein